MATIYDVTSADPSKPHRTFDDRPSSSSQEDGSTDGSFHDGSTTTRSYGHVPHSPPAGTPRAPRGGSVAPFAPQPGVFAPGFHGVPVSHDAALRSDVGPLASGIVGADVDGETATEQRQAVIRGEIAKEMKIKTGTENMLEALLSKNLKRTKDQRRRVESELSASNQKLEQLHRELDEEVLRTQSSDPRGLGPLPTVFDSHATHDTLQASRRVAEEDESETESPTYVLAEALQALEVDGMQPDYYVEKANSLVELFKRYPTLKYDLEWSVFGLRIQMMLLSDSREVAAAGYRLTRYAIADRKSIRIIRSLHTDELVILSLVKETKASMEREQALKFIRAFLDVKDGVHEIPRAVVRTLVSIAEYREDRLRSICIMTLAEIFVKDPSLLFNSGGVSVLNGALGEGAFGASESLTACFIHVLDSPRSRKYLRFGCELDAVFACFTEGASDDERKSKLQPAARAISTMLKTWPGLLTLSQNKAQPLRSLLQSFQYPEPLLRDALLELLFDALRIKSSSWSSTYLTGKRLTTHGKGRNAKTEQEVKHMQALYEHKSGELDLTSQFSALLLAILVEAGLIQVKSASPLVVGGNLFRDGLTFHQALSSIVEEETDTALKRKATLLLTEVLKRAHDALPKSVCGGLQVLPQLVPFQTAKTSDDNHISASTVHRMDSISRAIARDDGRRTKKGQNHEHTEPAEHSEPRSVFNPNSTVETTTTAVSGGNSGVATSGEKEKPSASMDEAHFRTAMMETNVLNSSNYNKWDWDAIHRIVEGPLTNPKRLDEAIKTSRFMKRLVGFYRPFKYKFSIVRNTKPNQRYVRTGCALMRTLIQTPEGTKHLGEHKVLRQLAECLAQLDRLSGLTSETPLFSQQHMADTLSWGYFALIGALSEQPSGLQMLQRWQMYNMFYHIVELKGRNDLILSLLGNMDYTHESHLRIILSKALTTGPKEVRIFATRLLRQYAVGHATLDSPVDWAIRSLVIQLYDPDVSVCQVAVKILEEACADMPCLEYVVRCRPSLDHLGEIGAPLLLRFLSTPVGYRYLDGLDYITQEMDDWFLGRNDVYVGLVEASLALAYVDVSQRNYLQLNDIVDDKSVGILPPHFYRELARTRDGCELLRRSGHLEEFVSTVRDFRLKEEDPEVLLKVKGCLWAVGNLGSMELSAPFLSQTDVVGCIVNIAENAAVLSMRGTAFFVLGLISRTQHGMEMLSEEGWAAAVDQNGTPLGSCLPTDLSKLCSVCLFRFIPSL